MSTVKGRVISLIMTVAHMPLVKLPHGRGHSAIARITVLHALHDAGQNLITLRGMNTQIGLGLPDVTAMPYPRDVGGDILPAVPE